MTAPDPELFRSARAAIDAVHRRPVSLRKWQLTSSEGVLRGAKISALIDATSPEPAISTYSLLAPDSVSTSAQTFLRSPMQILARMDVLAGGDGKPTASVSALQQLATIVVSQPVELPLLVHGVVAHYGCFGPRSGLIARASSRLAAVATGFDPRGLTVPETYLNRHRAEYLSAVANFLADPAALYDLQLRAFRAGAEEAEAIAKLA